MRGTRVVHIAACVYCAYDENTGGRACAQISAQCAHAHALACVRSRHDRIVVGVAVRFVRRVHRTNPNRRCERRRPSTFGCDTHTYTNTQVRRCVIKLNAMCLSDDDNDVRQPFSDNAYTRDASTFTGHTHTPKFARSIGRRSAMRECLV